MDYELHITGHNSPGDISLLRAYCIEYGYKFLDLRLVGGGQMRRQVMLAHKYSSSDYIAAAEVAYQIRSSMTRHGIQAHRIKLESRQLNEKAPCVYFETHWKLKLSHKTDKYFAWQLPTYVLVSTNYRDDTIVYATTRDSRTKSPDHLKESCTAINNHLLRLGLKFGRPHIERVIYDTNPSLDDGWTSIDQKFRSIRL